jgi:hypothetical protein
MAILALAGRRIDNATLPLPQFPLGNIGIVRRRIESEFRRLQARILISSAACGADLLALDVAGELGIARHVVLPFDQVRFRTSSVTDRPGTWGPLFDRVIAELQTARTLIVLDLDPNDAAAYAVVNSRILDQAQAMSAAASLPVIAMLVWEGESRGDGDLTEGFGREAELRGVPIVHVRSDK